MLLIAFFMMIVRAFLFMLDLLFLFGVVRMGTILEIEPKWKLEVELDGAALMLSIKCVEELYIYLWSIKSSISFIHFILFAEFVQGLLQLGFCLLPIIQIAKILFRSCRQFKYILESKDCINVIQKI